MTDSHLTIGQVVALYNVPAWRLRRVVDLLGAGQYRLIPRSAHGAIAAELERLGCFSQGSATEVPA